MARKIRGSLNPPAQVSRLVVKDELSRRFAFKRLIKIARRDAKQISFLEAACKF